MLRKKRGGGNMKNRSFYAKWRTRRRNICAVRSLLFMGKSKMLVSRVINLKCACSGKGRGAECCIQCVFSGRLCGTDILHISTFTNKIRPRSGEKQQPPKMRTFVYHFCAVIRARP